MPTSKTFKLAMACALLSLGFHAAAQAETPAAAPDPAPAPAEGNALSSEFVYKYLVGEVAGQRGDPGLASSIFLDLAKSSRDPSTVMEELMASHVSILSDLDAPDQRGRYQ